MLLKKLKEIILKTLVYFRKDEEIPLDIIGDNDFMEIYHQCKEYTQTSIERMYTLYKSIMYIHENSIIGDFIECGVWKGGSAMVIALTLKKLGVSDKNIYLYDTFEGMSTPTEKDVDLTGVVASEELKIRNKDELIWCYSSLEEVTNNLLKTGYPKDKIKFIKGKVEDTIPLTLPINISLLRLDTDWYESTKHEMIHLFPLLTNKGILIIDDFGHWEGAKKAILEYLKDNNLNYFINRIDYTGVLIQK